MLKKFLKDAPIGRKLAYVAAVPLLATICFAGYEVRNSWVESHDLERVAELAVLAPEISNVVHELQRERGTSAGYIKSGRNAEFTRRLAEQRKETDAKIAILEDYLSHFDGASYSPALNDWLIATTKKLDELAEKRSAISNGDATVPQMAKFYGKTISNAFHVVGELTHISTDAEATANISSYLAILEAKEFMGQERAMGAAGFADGKFAPPIYRRLIELRGAQDAELALFDAIGTKDQRDFYKATIQGPEVDEVARLRKLADDEPFGGSLEGTSASHWYDQITHKINLMKKVEDKIAGDLTDVVAAHQAHAERVFWTSVTSAAVVIAFSSWLCWYLSSLVGRSVKRMTTRLEQLADGDLDSEVQDQQMADEIGRAARAVETCRASLADAEHKAEVAAEEARAEAEAAAKILTDGALHFEKTAGRLVQEVAAGVSPG